MAAVSRSPSVGKSPSGDLRSFLYSPGLRILVGMGLGYVSHRLWAGPQYLLDSKLAQLDAAPTIQISTVRSRQIPLEGELVLLQNGVADKRRGYNHANTESLRCQSDTCHLRRLPCSQFDDVAAVKPAEDYADTRVPNQHLCGDFYLSDQLKEQYVTRGPLRLVNVKNVDADHFPLEIRWSAVYGTRAGWTRFLRRGTLFNGVFGRLSNEEDGDMKIEPCKDFPKECFTMTKPEIAKAVRAQVEADPDTGRVRTWGLGVGFLSFGFILSGVYSYAMN